MNKKIPKKIWLIVGVIFLIVAVVSGLIAFEGYMRKREALEQFDQLAQNVNQVNDGSQTVVDAPVEPERKWSDYSLDEKKQYYKEKYNIDVPEKNIDFTVLQTETNSDIYAWLYVPNTVIDLPVLQHPDNEDFYLNHNLDKNEGYPGCPYTQKLCNAKDFMDRMTVIYGHIMGNGTGFTELHNYEDKTFFDENRYFYIYTADDILVYEVFAAYAGSNNHLIYGHEWDDESWVQYLNDTLLPSADCHGGMHSAVPSYDFTADSKVVTLSTCVRNYPSERYLVQGVLLVENP